MKRLKKRCFYCKKITFYPILAKGKISCTKCADKVIHKKKKGIVALVKRTRRKKVQVEIPKNKCCICNTLADKLPFMHGRENRKGVMGLYCQKCYGMAERRGDFIIPETKINKKEKVK